MRFRWMYLLLIATPATLVVWFLNFQGAYQGQLTTWIFALALIAVVPLASLIGEMTEQLDMYFGPRLGGLLGASFGNIPELAIGISLLAQAHADLGRPNALSIDFGVIRGLLIGSVINNILFVLGSSVFIGALRNGRMQFSKGSAATYASMLALAVVGLALPTLAVSLAKDRPDAMVKNLISVPFALIFILSYVAYIATTVFNVGNRRRARRGKASAAKESGEQGQERERAAVTIDGAVVLADDANDVDARTTAQENADEDAAEEVARMKRRELRQKRPLAVPLALIGLATVTIATVVIAIVLVSVTNTVIVSTPLTPITVGLILFPIVCNLGEQAGAVISSWRDNMEGALSVAVGSSVQVALFVTPLLVLLSFLLAQGAPSLVLNMLFEPLQLIVIGLVTFVFALVSLDGETTWLEGLQLLAFYAMIVAVAFALPGQ